MSPQTTALELFWTQDEFSAEEITETVEGQAADSIEVVALDASGNEVPGLQEALTAPSLFARGRVVVVRGVERLQGAGLERLKEALTTSAVADRVILLAVSERSPSGVLKSFEGVASVKRVPRPRRSALVAWVAARMRKAGLKPGRDAAPALIEAVGPNLRELASAVEQMAVRKHGSHVTRDDVVDQFQSFAEQPVWALFDALLNHQRLQAFRVLHALLAQGDDPLAVLFALVSQLRYVMRTRSLVERSASLDDQELASALRVSSGRAAVLRRQARRASWPWLMEFHRLLAEADVELKGGETQGPTVGTAMPPEICLERLVSRVLALAQVSA